MWRPGTTLRQAHGELVEPYERAGRGPAPISTREVIYGLTNTGSRGRAWTEHIRMTEGRDSLQSPALLYIVVHYGWLGGYCCLLPDCLLPLSEMSKGRVLASLGLAVEEGPAVQVHLQPAVIYRGNGNGDLAAKLAEELRRYPSGLGKISSTNAVLDFQVGLVFCHRTIPPMIFRAGLARRAKTR